MPRVTHPRALAFDRLQCPHVLRSHQTQALDALDTAVDAGRRRCWIALPPGAGKTLVGLETIRRRGDRGVVFGPNTAIQAQWCAAWENYQPGGAGTDRNLTAPVTVLTYQALATFDHDTEDSSCEDPLDSDASLVSRLHPNGRALLEQLQGSGPVTIVLDECHHLLEVWGRLLAEVLDLLPEAFVLGLTATPPESLDTEQADLVHDLFGDIVFQASIPAAVREAELAPFAELAWLTAPTPDESQWLSAQAERFSRLTVEVTDPEFATVGLFTWLDRRFTDPGTPWAHIERDDPDLAAAVLRLSQAGMIALPPGARLREEHRRRPDADDWVAVLNDWVRKCLQPSDQEKDAAAVDAIARTLPSVGYQLTRRGIRRGRSPVDRVLARSAAKADAAVEIVAAESQAVPERSRILVVCDFEQASARPPDSVRTVLADEAGSARLMLRHVVDDPRTAALEPVLMTGRTVAAAPQTARRLIDFVADTAPGCRLTTEIWPDGDVSEVTGSWSDRDRVELVTAFFEDGPCRVLVGTRALLGEGWDARRVNALVDLTAATTSSAVVQTRGRAVRTDPDWPGKVANTWSVVCVAEEHPRGGTDWDRFVRKHTGYFATDDTGAIVSGVSHVDAAFSPYAAPAAETFDAVNAAMLVRADQRAQVARSWRVGEPYDDRVAHTVRIRPRQREHRAERAASSPAAPPELVMSERGPRRASDGGVVWWHPWRAVRAVWGTPPWERFAAAVADGLAAADLSPVGSDALRTAIDADGTYRFVLSRVDEPTSLLFAQALDETVSAPTDPRYLVPRYVLGADDDASPVGAGWRLVTRTLRAEATAWHAVPRCSGVNAERAQAFARAWNRWVSAGSAVYTRNPDGAGLLAASRGFDPLEADTLLRPAWS